MKARKPDLKSLVDDVTKDRHSPLFIAMSENYDAISDAFAKRRPNWSELVAGFAELGLVAGNGKPASIRTAQQTWYRVRSEKGRRQSTKRALLPPPLRPMPPVSGVAVPGGHPATEMLVEQQTSASPIGDEASALLANLRKQVDKRSGR